VQLKELPRMADFARLGEAVCRAIDWRETFATVYQRLRLDAVADSLEGSPAIEALRGFIDREKNYNGTIGELWLSIKPEKYEEGWVRSARGFGSLLRAHASALREVGIGIEFPPRQRSGRRVSISSIPEQRTQRAQRTPETDRVVLSSADSALDVEYMAWKQ